MYVPSGMGSIRRNRFLSWLFFWGFAPCKLIHYLGVSEELVACIFRRISVTFSLLNSE
jgi:hypothetical protein